MAKKSVKIEDVEFNASKNQIEPDKVQALIKDLQQMLEEENESKPPSVKKEFVVLISDPEGKITDDHTAWVLQIEEDDSPMSVVEKISLAATKYNNGSRAGKKMPVSSVGEAAEVVTRKFFVEENIWVKTKEPVLVVKTDNKLLDLGQETE